MSYHSDLIFAYNADSGLIALLGDITHRIVSPQTYPCKLCALTYSFGGMIGDWKNFVDTWIQAEQINRCQTLADLKQLRRNYENSPLPVRLLHLGRFSVRRHAHLSTFTIYRRLIVRNSCPRNFHDT